MEEQGIPRRYKWNELCGSSSPEERIKRIRLQWLTPKKIRRNAQKQGLAITTSRFHGVVVITSALHAEGQRLDTGWNQTVFKSVCECRTQ